MTGVVCCAVLWHGVVLNGTNNRSLRVGMCGLANPVEPGPCLQPRCPFRRLLPCRGPVWRYLCRWCPCTVIGCLSLERSSNPSRQSPMQPRPTHMAHYRMLVSRNSCQGTKGGARRYHQAEPCRERDETTWGHRGHRRPVSRQGKYNPSCCPLCPHTTPFPEEKSILGVISMPRA